MGKPLLLFTVAAFVLFALTINCTYALQVAFYLETNYEDYADGVQENPTNVNTCYNLEVIHIKSMKTDECLMLYNNPNCEHYKTEDQFSIRVNNDTPQFWEDDAFDPWTDYRKVQSFRVCSQQHGGGPLLDVDYYNTTEYRSSISRKWRNICSCQNIPVRMRGGTLPPGQVSFLNYGNEMQIFSEENCQGKSRFIYAGDNLSSVFAVLVGPGFIIKSFRPHGLPNCRKLSANIFKFYFKNGTSDQPIMKKVWLATSGDIVNNGAAEITQQFTLSETVTQTVEFTISTGYTQMNEVGVDASVTISGETGVPLVAEGDISASISANYKYSAGSSVTNTTTQTATKSTTIQNVQTVTVPGCHVCSVTAYVNQAKNFPIEYDSSSYISGYAGTGRMTAADLKAILPVGVDYVKDEDEYTVIAITSGTMYAQFGLETFIEADCKKIPNCSPNSLPATTTKENRNIGTSMGKDGDWNSLSESSFAF